MPEDGGEYPMYNTREELEEICEQYKIPSYMIPGVRRYVFDHIKPGGFMMAVFSNDFMSAARRADPENRKVLPEWASLIHNELPIHCYGSPEKVKEWLLHGGPDDI